MKGKKNKINNNNYKEGKNVLKKTYKGIMKSKMINKCHEWVREGLMAVGTE